MAVWVGEVETVAVSVEVRVIKGDRELVAETDEVLL